MNWRYC